MENIASHADGCARIYVVSTMLCLLFDILSFPSLST